MIRAIHKRLEEREEGFTLIELLVVVIIIGILAAIAIPTFLNQRQRGWQAELTSDVRNLAIEIESQAAAAPNGAYPVIANNTDLQAMTQGTAQVTSYTRDATNTRFCFVGRHNSLSTTLSQVAYDSGAGGLQPFLPGGYTCAAGVVSP